MFIYLFILRGLNSCVCVSKFTSKRLFHTELDTSRRCWRAGCTHQAHLPTSACWSACVKEVHGDACTYLPRLLELGRPPLLQDGLHRTDEFCSDVLENKSSETLDDIACAVVTRVTFSYSMADTVICKSGGGGIRTRVLRVSGSYTVVLGRCVVVIMAFPQLQSQSLQSVQLVQSRHAFLDEGHHPGRKTIHSLIGSPVHPEGAHTHQDSVFAASQTPNAKKKKLNWLYIYKSFLRQNQVIAW